MFGRNVYAIAETSVVASAVEINGLLFLSYHPEKCYRYGVREATAAIWNRKKQERKASECREVALNHDSLHGEHQKPIFKKLTDRGNTFDQIHYDLNELLNMWAMVYITGQDVSTDQVPDHLQRYLDFDVLTHCVGLHSGFAPLSTLWLILRDISPDEDLHWLEMCVEPAWIERRRLGSALGDAFASILMPVTMGAFVEKTKILGKQVDLKRCLRRALAYSGCQAPTKQEQELNAVQIRYAFRYREVQPAATVEDVTELIDSMSHSERYLQSARQRRQLPLVCTGRLLVQQMWQELFWTSRQP
ncbi:hypothetical protein TI39_contig487g00002 [Zymoseptoria brevis]|uniref:Uncharacterized protein n=1 Tax=Zymoseptoria brevis TaxID=1047168 RepID=A0A0F4GJP0_9PEZI|nr:hypothetical protein TI39_contig487g00002 [Zymoseptoria brevis]